MNWRPNTCFNEREIMKNIPPISILVAWPIVAVAAVLCISQARAGTNDVENAQTLCDSLQESGATQSDVHGFGRTIDVRIDIDSPPTFCKGTAVLMAKHYLFEPG
jgi:hypothetical protein